MNLHLIQDTVFLNDFADLLNEMGEIENNHFYVYYSESKNKNEFKYLIKEKFSKTKIINCELADLHNQVSSYKNIFVHLLSDLLFDFVEKVDPKKNLIWCTWGSDFYGPDEIFTTMVFDEASADLFNKWNTESVLQDLKKNKFPINIKYPYRFIREEYHYNLRKKEILQNYQNTQTEYIERKRKLLKKFACHMNYGYEDHLFIKEFYQIDPKFSSLFYTMFDEVDDTVGVSSYLSKNGINETHKKIFIGNCATLHNNHLELIPVLKNIKEKHPTVKFIVPLSYGNKRYTEYISGKYKEDLGDSFFPIYDFIGKQEYYKIINSIDVMIMNHNVNQGGTNLFKAIYYGKKIFIKERNPLGIHLKKNGVIMSDISELNDSLENVFMPLSPDIIKGNKIAINQIFSKAKAAENMRTVFNDLATA